MFKKLYLCSALFLLAGCSIVNEKLYEGNLKPNSEHAIISSINFDERKGLKISTLKINGKVVNQATAASFLVLPGVYTIDAKVATQPEFTGHQLDMRWKEAIVQAVLVAEKGHTYIPVAKTGGEMVKLEFDDKGQDFPNECLPLWIFVNTSSNPGARAHSNGKVCKI